MREISVFDVIGPVMIGPSSSHTAGALKIAKIARNLVKHKIKSVNFKLYGSFSKTYNGHGTDKALLGGILDFNTDDARIRDSFALADAADIAYSFEICDGENDFHPNTVEITVDAENGETLFLRGSSIGGGEVEITNINGTDISFSGKYNAVIVKQKDKPGVVADIANIFTKHKINIAFMRVYRESNSGAVSIIEIDGDPSDEFLEEMEKIPSIDAVRYFHFAY
ncbi:MAG: L-serine ammonia-lyase, iron-sulfur-dependent subunit beta [Clostridiales bacterium]|nr:L-serine ammonia-lyase, iron-sulfur-dependent subunit beta [Clostridiales bacterium]